MKKTRATFEPWLEDYLRKRYPELEQPLLAAINACDTIEDEGRLDAELLAPIVEAASSSRRPLYENATTFLGSLAAKYPLARDSVAKMSAAAQSHIRFNALLCLDKHTPVEFTVSLLRQALRDKSASVRGKAADWAGRLRIRDVVPDLEHAFAAEKNAKAKRTIEFELRLLRDGYILESAASDRYRVTTFCSGGTVSRGFSRTEFEQRGIQSIVDEMTSQ